ncbi:CDP-glycerol glycerophosphotransferase family protein [Methanobacterium bryantii]|uniref:TarS C-terminal domain-containing protein n=1 Tax=Methanobacterium bryantii TaxID=2161 RepID=A0A2A2HAM6_METBR|nr:CDP-glycerol glycerophosphotransferase family protein [Methanobacterium bryantii]PAV06304.1 hypothetical protein ASJ80_15885 [Methanobacterium bryantii]
MKEELIIDYTNELSVKFKVTPDIEVKEIIVDIFGGKKTYKPIKKGEYYTFSLSNSVFLRGMQGIIQFYFSFIDENGSYKITNFARFNKFEMIGGGIKNVKNNYIVPHQTRSRNFILIVTDDFKKQKLNVINFLTSFNCNKESININGVFKTFLLSVDQMEIGMEGRKTFSKFRSRIDFSKIQSKYSDNLAISTVIPFDTSIEEDIYDFFLYIHLKEIPEPVKIRFGHTRFLMRQKVKDYVLKFDEETIYITPYFTFSGQNLSLHVERINNDVTKNIENIKQNNREDIWLIGEQPYKAQDTGKAFFEYIRRTHPEKEAYYVIDFNSPEYENVKDLGNIIDYRSKEHFEMCLKATHLIGSHHIDYLYPIRNKEFISKVKAKKIFLQHGVLGVKNLANLYLNQKEFFDVDMFCVSTEREKQITVEDLKFSEEQVKVTGLSRFDSLFKNDIEVKKQILIIPTWRDWLQNVDTFLESEYYQRYQSLISNKEFLDICRKNDVDVVFCLHPNMQKYSSFFKSDDVKIVFQGEIDVQLLIKESMLMITDYSSVAFDFAFLNKPVIYYQFDQKRFLGKAGSHLDLERELPGTIISNEEEITSVFNKIAENGFRISDENLNRVNSLLKYKDTRNSERIFNEITNFKFKRTLTERIKRTEKYKKAFNYFRRNRVYFPLMKLFYKIFKLLPLKERYVFESGVGVQYSDAPKALYEELMRIKPDAECVWFYNKTSFIHPMNTKVVKRLSLGYYYYLATSKYWINNQNFPSYITKRKGTTYLQTWHGTPVKKMLFDLKEIYGREKGYVQRVENAKNQWSYLISQNSYATKHFRTAFRYNGPILEEGYPRNDILINNPEKELIINKIRHAYSISPSKKIILYAPTFRDNAKVENKFESDIKIDFKEFNDRFGEEYILLLRMHVTVSSDIEIPEEYKHCIINVSSYPDIQELYLMTDILITDYSSVLFDFAVLKRPMIFYAYDLEEYKNDIRGAYLDYEKEVPGKIVKNQNELFHAINNIEELKSEYRDKLSKFKQKYAPLDDGNAAKRIVKKILLQSHK